MLRLEGGAGLVNYRARQKYYVVDRLFAAAELSRRRKAAKSPHCTHRWEATENDDASDPVSGTATGNTGEQSAGRPLSLSVLWI